MISLSLSPAQFLRRKEDFEDRSNLLVVGAALRDPARSSCLKKSRDGRNAVVTALGLE